MRENQSRQNQWRYSPSRAARAILTYSGIVWMLSAVLLVAASSAQNPVGTYVGRGGIDQAQAGVSQAASHAGAMIGNLTPVPQSRFLEPYDPFLPQSGDGGLFDVNAEFFNSPESGDFGQLPEPKTGFFAGWERVYIQFSRPLSKLGPNPAQLNGAGNMLNPIDPLISDPVNNAAGDGVVTPAFISTNDPGPLFGNFSRAFDGDYAWGNRWEIGYMTEADTGWTLSAYRIQGPTFGDAKRTGIFNLTQTTPVSPVTVTLPDGSTIDVSGVLTAANLTRTNLVLEYTGLEREVTSLFWSVEVNKEFRHQTKGGALIEPFFGVRYVYLRDEYVDTLHSLDFFSTFPYLSINPRHDGFLTIYSQTVQNHVVGPQVGFRYQKTTGRFVISSEFRAVAGYNRQFLGIEKDPGVLGIFTPFEARQEARDEFVPYGQLRVQGGYEITRAITIHGGFDLMYFGRGMARVNTAPQEYRPFPIGDQDVILSGFTGGIVINR